MAETAPLDECGAPLGGRAQWLRAADGVRIRLAVWPGPDPVLILPGRTEYIEKYGPVVADLAAAGRGAAVVDWRGQGLADRALADPLKGHVGDFAEYQRDLDAVLAALDPAPRHWLAHSMGGCIALAALMRGLPCRAVTFSAPMLGPVQPRHLTLLAELLGALARPLGVDTGYAPTSGPAFGLPSMTFETNILTTDRAQFERMRAQILDDPRLALGGPTLRFAARAIAEMRRLSALPSPAVPALFGLGGDEAIVSAEAVRDRARRWPGAVLIDYPGARHELTMERPEVRDDFLRRALAHFARHAG